jgi:hypothetical protein
MGRSCWKNGLVALALALPASLPAQEASPEVSRSEVSRSEVSRPEVSRSELSRTELSRAEVSRPELPRPEGSRPEVSRPGSGPSEGVPGAVSRTGTLPAEASPSPKSMMERVSEVLGLPPLRPVVPRRLPQIELRAEARDSLSLFHPKAWLLSRQAMLKMMGLLPDGFDLRNAMLDRYPREVVGLYDAHEGQLLINRDLEPEIQDEILVHELVHALQDQHFKLEQLIPEGMEDEDRARAVRAVVEGQAVRVASRFSGSSHERVLAKRNTPVPEPTPEVLALLGPHAPAVSPGALRSGGTQLYQAGATFLEAFERRFGSGSAVFFAMPASTEQLIHFDCYLSHEKPVAVTLKELPFKVAHQWKLIDEMTLGELNVAFWLGEPPGSPTASGWGGDRLAGFQADNGRTMTAWRTVWDTEEDAIEFQQAARDRIRHRFPTARFVRQLPNGFLLATDVDAHGVVRLGSEVRVINGADADDIEALLGEAW